MSYEIQIPRNLMLLPVNRQDEGHAIFVDMCSELDEKRRILIENIKSIPTGDSVRGRMGKKSGFVRGYKSDVIELLTEFLFKRFNIDKKIVSINTLQRLQNVIFGKTMAKQKANDFLNNDVLSEAEKAVMLRETYDFRRSIIPSNSPDFAGDEPAENGRKVLLSSINFRALDTREGCQIPQFSASSVLFSTRSIWLSLLDFYELIEETHFKNTDRAGELLMQNILQQYASHLEYIIRKNELFDVFKNNVLKMISRKESKIYNRATKQKEQDVYETQAIGAVLTAPASSVLMRNIMVSRDDVDYAVATINEMLNDDALNESGHDELSVLKGSGQADRAALLSLISPPD